MRKLLCLLLCMFSISSIKAACPSADLNGDCKVNLEDFAFLASEWLTIYDFNDLINMTGQWQIDGTAFVTTWDTSLGEATTVTLGLAGTVDARINWGDGYIETVTTAGPHVHDYVLDGIYSVSVTGKATAYNSRDNGGAFSERAKLISVDRGTGGSNAGCKGVVLGPTRDILKDLILIIDAFSMTSGASLILM